MTFLGMLVAYGCYSNVPCQAQQVPAALPRVMLIDGSVRPAAITAISAAGQLTLSDGERQLALDQLWKYQPPAVSAEDAAAAGAAEPAARVDLLGGGYLLARSLTLAEERFNIAWRYGAGLALPLEAVHSLVRLPAAEEPGFARAQAKPSDEEDQIFLAVEDKVESIAGLIETISATTVGFTWQEKARTLPWPQFHGVVFASLAEPAPRTGRTLVHLADGSQLLAKLQQLEAGKLQLLLAGNVTVEVPWTDVLRLEHHSPRMTLLSAHDPVEVAERPLATFARPWRRDRSVLGRELRLGDQTYQHGIGVAASSRLTYKLDGGYDQLLVTVGIDQETAGRGNCEVAILADGQVIKQATITGADRPLPWQIDLRGVRRLTLSVEPGEGLDLGDHVDWIEPRLLRSRP